MSTALGSIPAYSSQSFFNFTKVDCNNNDTVTLGTICLEYCSKWETRCGLTLKSLIKNHGSYETQLKSVGDNNDGMELLLLQTIKHY